MIYNEKVLKYMFLQQPKHNYLCIQIGFKSIFHPVIIDNYNNKLIMKHW